MEDAAESIPARKCEATHEDLRCELGRGHFTDHSQTTRRGYVTIRMTWPVKMRCPEKAITLDCDGEKDHPGPHWAERIEGHRTYWGNDATKQDPFAGCFPGCQRCAAQASLPSYDSLVGLFNAACKAWPRGVYQLERITDELLENGKKLDVALQKCREEAACAK